ncbi:MAG TPA: TolC family protein, partial [Bdellovibrio sp.]|uniref:TolC family protein n=1 Tax=Bdellovibrio sp. TaxID=28201 RepID=UPI002EEE653C
SIQKQQQYDAVEASQRYLQLATSRYKLGLDPYLNVLSAQITLLTNQQTDLNLKMQQLTSTVRLIESLGGGWDSSRLPTEKELLGDSADESKNKKKD